MLVCCGCTLVFATVAATGQATPAALHLTASVYAKQTASNGTVTSRERVFQNGTRIGEDFSTCTKRPHGTFKCQGEYTLTHGHLKFAGVIPGGTSTNTLAITGGTGRYSDARGHVRTEYNRTGTSAKETVTFSG
jgi:hypothetical protein